MATARLTDNDKSEIAGNLSNVINRALNNKKFPLRKEKVFNWLSNQMKSTHRDAYLLLRDECPKLITNCRSWEANFFIRSDINEYKVSIHTKIPTPELRIHLNDPHYSDVLEWVKWYWELHAKVDEADTYAHHLIWGCTSVGQIKRLLPDEILRFVPSHLLDFSEVERKSRVPRGVSQNTDQFENMMQMAALGALSPSEAKGVNTNVTTCDRFADTI